MVETVLKAIEFEIDLQSSYYYLALTYYKIQKIEEFCFFLKKAKELGKETSLWSKCD